MPLLRYRPAYHIRCSDTSLTFGFPSVSSSYLFPRHRFSPDLIPKTYVAAYLPTISLCIIFSSVHLLAYSPRPFYLPLPIRPSLQLAPPYSPLSSTTGTPLSALFSTHPSPLISPPTYSSPNLSRLQLTFLQLILLPTHLKRIYDTGIIEYPAITKMYLRVG